MMNIKIDLSQLKPSNWSTARTSANLIEILYNNVVPFLAGILTVTQSPYWVYLLILPAMFQLRVKIKKEKEALTW
jgi:hypothetical protein